MLFGMIVQLYSSFIAFGGSTKLSEHEFLLDVRAYHSGKENKEGW